MELGIKDIRKFNPQYHQDGTKGENKKKSNKNKGKKRTVKAFDGESFKVSIKKEKKIRQTKQMVSKLKLNLKMLSPKKFLVLDNSGNCVIGSPKNGTSLNTIRKKLGLMIEEKKNKSKQNK